MSNLECIAATKEKVQQEKENKLKEKEANKARKAKEKKLNNIMKAQEKDAKKLSRDLKAAEHTRKRVGKGKKQGTVLESQIACDVQLSIATLGVEVILMEAPSWASEAPSPNGSNAFAPCTHSWFCPNSLWAPSFAPYKPSYLVGWWHSPTFGFETSPLLQFGSIAHVPDGNALALPPRLVPSLHTAWAIPPRGPPALPLETAPSYRAPIGAMERTPEIIEGFELWPPSLALLQQVRVPWGMPWTIPPPNPMVGGAESSSFMGA